MTDFRLFGIDPGPVPGLVMLDLNDRQDGAGRWLDGFEVLQCSAGLLPELLDALLMSSSAGELPALVQVERFVTGRRASRSSTAIAGARTRDLVGEVENVVRRFGTPRSPCGSVQRSAAAVMPWASDQRLQLAGLLAATKGMPHARSAARHALFAACHDGGLIDPLSKEFNR